MCATTVPGLAIVFTLEELRYYFGLLSLCIEGSFGQSLLVGVIFLVSVLKRYDKKFKVDLQAIYQMT